MTNGTGSDLAARLAAHLGMAAIPHEGPLFVRTYEATEPFGTLPPRYAGTRPAYNAIYALLTPENFSALHRLATDELWHFYRGSPIELLLLHHGGRSETVVLGPDVLGGQRPQFCVPRGVWMGARLLAPQPGAYALIGNSLTPGFDYADYDPGYRAELIAAYPDRAEIITALTRADSIHRPDETPPTSSPKITNPSQPHYEHLLGPRYAWMTGDFAKLLERAKAELAAAGLTAANSTPRRAIDLGAGRGQHALALSLAGWGLTALEPCVHLREELLAHFASHHQRVDASATDILEWIVAPESAPWQAILCLGDTLCHLPDLAKVDQLLSTAARRLAPGGRLVLTFRDYSDPAATGTVRTIPVKSDTDRILTCVLHTGASHVDVHDLFHERNGETWTLHASRYAKVRVDPARVLARLAEAGLAPTRFAAPGGMIGIIGARAP